MAINGNFGYYDASGNEASVYLYDFPEMCKWCTRSKDESESVQCHITRLIQLSAQKFECDNHAPNLEE